MKPYVDVPNSGNMRVLRDVLSMEGVGKKNVIVRGNITEEFWQEVIATASKYRVCAVGTPGIGKTASTCILICLLLKRQQTVVYHVRTDDKDGYVYMFTPPAKTNGDVDVVVIPEDQFVCTELRFNNESIYYVVDPGKFKNNCDPPNIYIGKVIIVASPDNRHWGGGEFTKIRDSIKGTFCFYPVWSLDELINAKDLFDEVITDATIEERYENVGGIPRHIFTDQKDYNRVLVNQMSPINRLTNVQLRSLTLGDAESAETFENFQPTSSIMVYEYSDPSFKNVSVTVLSRRVARLLVNKHKKFWWNVILDEGGTRGSTTWKLFEMYCQSLMLVGYSQKYSDYKYHDGVKLQGVKKLSVPALQLGGCTKIKETRENLVDAAKQENNDNIVFYSSDKNYPLFDFIYKRNNILYAFQVATGKDHLCKPHLLKAAIEEAGNDYEFLLHYLTFDERYDGLKFDPGNPFKDEIFMHVRSALTNDWTIKVIRVPCPNEEGGGRTEKVTRTKLSQDQIFHFLNFSGGKNRQILVEQLLSIETGSKGHEEKIIDNMILQFTTSELKACLRALQLPVSGNKEKLVERLQNAIELLLELIEGLRNMSALTNPTQTQKENDVDTVEK